MMGEQEFEREMDRRLGLGRAGEREERASAEVLLPRPRGREEEEALHQRVMDLLRERVLALEKEEDPDFDPLCPVEQDLSGLADDPLRGRLATLAEGQMAPPRSVTGIPERL